jgi:hypothetical protein
MGMTNFTDKPRGVLKQSKGMKDSTYDLSRYTVKQLLEPRYSILGWFLKRAVNNPGVVQYRYHEENGYEYEDRALFDKTMMTLHSTLFCPVQYSHHIGQTCFVCKMKD